MNNENFIGKKAIISPSNDNENYNDYRDEVLIVTHASNEGMAYDSSMYPMMLMDFTTVSGREFPFALYEYEIQFI